MHFRMTYYVLVFVLTFFSGCAQGPLKVKPIATTEHPAALVETLGDNIDAAAAQQVDLLSPTWFAKATASHAAAQDGVSKGIALSTILDRVAKGNAQLENALAVALKSRQALPATLKSRAAALQAGADRYIKPFAKNEAAFLKLTRAVESDNLKYVRRNKKKVDDQYRALELSAIKDDALGEVRRIFDQARAAELDELVPKSVLVAQDKLSAADQTIARNRYDKAAIAEAVDTAMFYANRMLQIGKTVATFNEKPTEDAILWAEQLLSRVNGELERPDARNLPFEARQMAISDAIAAAKRDRLSLSNLVETKNIEIERLKQRVSLLEGRTYQERIDKERLVADKQRLTADARRLAAERERLASEKRFNERYTQVQGFFAADQADVYKQANQLIIRLKAMRFPVGRADIQPEHTALLTTVQNAIQAFGNAQVTVEGHTDSTGSEAMNQALSEMRAEAVRQYLIDSGTLPAANIASVGYGSTRPLASNATRQGRAVNRRIDVVILPTKP